ncbi:MAG TPA: polymer-forming cytoskeletal protein [Chthoniobacterales bacterium]|jgi:cytoskeletal protein CcmA (bactofilin family)
MEYAAARSTLCRQCGKHFVISPNEPAPAKTVQVVREAAGPSFFRKIEGILNRPRITSVACFDCGARQELTSAATSTICPSCSVHMDLRDYKINGSFSRNIRTHGEVHITANGDLSSTNILCRTAIVEGKLRGSLRCVERAEFRIIGKIQGKVSAPEIIIGKKASVQFFRQLEVGSIEIRGAMWGEILAGTVVTIRSSGALDGNVIARAINVEKGGTFTGQLVIGRQSLEQAELLPEFAAEKKRPPIGTLPHSGPAFGLPATS